MTQENRNNLDVFSIRKEFAARINFIGIIKVFVFKNSTENKFQLVMVIHYMIH